MAYPSSDFHPSGFYSRVFGSFMGAVMLLAVEIPYHPTIFCVTAMPVHSRVVPYFNVLFMLILSQRL